MLRFLLLLLLAYFAFRIARNLWRAVSGDAQRPADRVVGLGRQSEPPQRNVWDREVEEARYRDL